MAWNPPTWSGTSTTAYWNQNINTTTAGTLTEEQFKKAVAQIQNAEIKPLTSLERLDEAIDAIRQKGAV